jgi:FdhD protein
MPRPVTKLVNTVVEVPVQRPAEKPTLDHVANEVPVAFVYNGVPHAVMLATPADFDEFALGFSLSEGIIQKPSQLHSCSVEESVLGITLSLELDPTMAESLAKMTKRRRSIEGRTGCGLCGTEHLTEVIRPISTLASREPFPLNALYMGSSRLTKEQKLQQLTGATHAACHVDKEGNIRAVREDVGRHNALDKTLGVLAREGHDHSGAILVTSRASLEMVQKTAACGYALLAAVSGPTAAAIRIANSVNLSLVGFLRGTTCVVYAHPEGIQGI